MADLVFRSTTRGGRDFFEVTDDGMTYGGKDRYNIKTDESMNYADTVDEVLAELVFDGAWRINYDKIEVDELGIGDEYKEIVKLIRKKYNWLYNLPKGSKGRQFYFDIGRYFKQELKKGTDYDKIFDKIDSVIEKNNNFEESKKMDRKSIKEGKTMKKNRMKEKCEIMNRDEVESIVYDNITFSNVTGEIEEVEFIDGSFGTIRWLDSDGDKIEVCGYKHKKPIHKMTEKRMTERFDPPKNWDFEDMLDDYGMEYLQENDSDNEPFSMGDFNEIFGDDCWEAVRSAFYGGRYGFDRDSFNPNDDYFRFNGYGNVESIPYLDDYLKDMIDEESFYDWCVDQGYFESDEDDNE